MGLSSCVWQRDLERLITGRMFCIACMSQGTCDHISDLQRAMAVVHYNDLCQGGGRKIKEHHTQKLEQYSKEVNI